jgi:prepilin-type N-terminal cleavage/methylation domain-containing protein
MNVPRAGRRAARGFTLVELITVIVILAVLAAVAVPRFFDLRGKAEQAAIDGWVGGLRSAYNIAFATQLSRSGGYTDPFGMSVFNITRCDNVPIVPNPDPTVWTGHYMGLVGIRDSVFRDPNENACSGNTIQFTSATNRLVTITNTGTGVTWTAIPAY